MPRVKPLAFLLGLYIPVLLLGLLLPRNTEIDIDATPTGIISRILHEILYLTGPPEIFLNFLLFIPFFLALLFLNPALSRYSAALISCLTSAGAELAQSQIPGRVSSMRDFLSNCIGVVVALAVITGFPKGKSPKSF
jgi:glycopeptide antibiotics resistance protein